MKKSIIIAAALAAALTSCQKEQLREADGHGFTVRAVREACISTKATVSDDGAFSWSAADAFSLYANGKYYDFTTTDGGASASFNGYYYGDQGGYAVFPNNLEPAIGDAVSVTLPATYEWKENIINTPMLATFDAGEDLPESITFNHLGGLIRVTLRNIPETATKFVFSTTNNMPITGTFTAEKESEDDGSKLQIKSTEDSNTEANSVAFTFVAGTAAKMSFYIPLPVGEYAVKIALYDSTDQELWAINGSKTHVVTRAKYIQTTAITIASTNADGESSSVSQEVPANFSGTYYLPNTAADVYLTMNSTDNGVKIAYANETSAKQPANVYIDCGGSTIKNLDIDLSESHVEISGNEGNNATIGNLNAKSSNTTLVLDKTVTIGEKLTVAAGSVEIAGKVNNVEVANTVDKAVTVKVTEDATVEGTLSVAKAASVEVAGTVAAVAVKTDVSSVTIVGEVKTVEVSKDEASTGEEKTVILVTESGKVTDALTDNTNTGTDASGSSITIVAASATAGSGAGQIKEVKNSTGSTVSGAVKSLDSYMAEKIQAGGEFTLDYDIKGSIKIADSKSVIINLNGKTISNSESDKATFTVAEGASLTINGEGNITNTATGKPAIENNGTLTINGGKYSGVASAIELRAGALTINDGSFTATAADFSESGSEGFNTISGAAVAVSQYDASKAVKLAVTGGTFFGQKAIYENDSRTDATTNVDIYIDSRLSDIGKVSISNKHNIPYLTFSAGAKQRFMMTFKGTMASTLKGKFEYSLGGGDWTTVTSGNSNVYFGGELGNLRLRGKSEIGTATNTSNYAQISMNYSSAPVAASGDIRVLIDWESYASVSTSNARFANLFYSGCKTMTSAPKLPATNLADYCYYSMFKGCTSLTAAPELPAETLKNRCYYEMFKNCSSLSSVTIKATSAENHAWGGVSVALNEWLSGTASEGTVYAPAAAISSDGTANNLSDYIPSGWSVSTPAE